MATEAAELPRAVGGTAAAAAAGTVGHNQLYVDAAADSLLGQFLNASAGLPHAPPAGGPATGAGAEVGPFKAMMDRSNDKKLGIFFHRGANNKGAVIRSVVAGSQAAVNFPRIVPGLMITEINGQDISEMSQDEIGDVIRSQDECELAFSGDHAPPLQYAWPTPTPSPAESTQKALDAMLEDSEPEDDDAPVCRICYGRDNGKENGFLFQPCR